MLKKLIKLLIIILPLFGIVYSLINEPLPDGKQGPDAESLTDRMLESINFTNWDSTVAVQWTFANKHHYIWDKKRHWVQVSWGDMKVLYNTKTGNGKAYENEKELDGNNLDSALEKAWELFANDSFWLAAPFKVRDPGTIRHLIKTDSTNALLVTYMSGGVTPGDSYLWILNENYLPVAWKMWVSVVPIGGIEYTWEKWNRYSTGAKLSSYHEGFIPVEISDIKLAMSIEDITEGSDPFENL